MNEAEWQQIDQKKREAGKRYEAFVATTLREQGWTVTENGLDGVNDHGIDLIATRYGVTRYIQCKGWNKNRLIHEDVVSHLFGSVAAIEGPDNLNGIEMYIYSPANLDDYATSEAQKLNITLARVRAPNRDQRKKFKQYSAPHWPA